MHVWARLHKTGMAEGNKMKDFELSMAEGKKGMENPNLEMFHAPALEAKLFPDGRVAFTAATTRAGMCLVEEAKFSFDCAGCYSVSIAP
mmetsp:Transcript_78441/g.208292  ORF Transcript_78441/g.208292 Transcript_78441/m.208292 type:complete len:89 (+) Transcript_78441:366-632(+)